MIKISKYSVLVLPLVFAANTALGAGFGLYEFSARGNAMGGAVLAGEAEPASIALNPALITDLKGSQVQAGSTFVTARARVAYNGETTDPKHAFWALPNFFYTQQINDKLFTGIGIFERFGLSNTYEDKTWAGAKNIYDVGLTSVSVQPTVAYKVTDRLSAAAGLEVMYFKFQEKKMAEIKPYPGLYDTKIDADGVGVSPMLALAYKANEKVNFGASFRFRTKEAMTGTSNSTFPALNSDVRGDVTMPAQLAMGVSYKPIDDLLVEFNWTNIFWSSFDSIDIDFKDTNVATSDKKEWKDTYRIGFGAEYKLTPKIRLRGSYIYDKSPVNNDYMDVMVPVDNRHLIGTGAGFDLGKNYTLDLSYTYLIGTSLGGHTPIKIGDNASDIDSISYSNGSGQLAGISIRHSF